MLYSKYGFIEINYFVLYIYDNLIYFSPRSSMDRTEGF